MIQAITPSVPWESKDQDCFSSQPEGLAIDPETGVIDINQSETGLKYRVSFAQGNNSCHVELTIAGYQLFRWPLRVGPGRNERSTCF